MREREFVTQDSNGQEKQEKQYARAHSGKARTDRSTQARFSVSTLKKAAVSVSSVYS